MPLILWDDTLCLGVDSMDEDHHRMIDAINAAFDALQSGQEKALIDKILDKLTMETISHFDREEQIMQASGYPDTDWKAHQETHNDLKQNILDMQESYLADRDATLTLETFQTLKRWLTDHIEGPDRLYTEFIRHKAQTPQTDFR